MILGLSRAGYGSVNEIELWDARKVLQAQYFEAYRSDYERAWVEINRK